MGPREPPNGQWVALEKRLYQDAFPHGVRLVLYDLSSVYFEGKGPPQLSRYGHSSDHRSDRTMEGGGQTGGGR